MPACFYGGSALVYCRPPVFVSCFPLNLGITIQFQFDVNYFWCFMSDAKELQKLAGTDATTIAIAGCSKNAGKTTAMNAVSATWQGKKTGILSIGIDGEEADFWLGVPKPKIIAPPGTLFATGERTLHCASGSIEIIERTGIQTPLGELIIARTPEGSRLLLAGVRHKDDVRRIKARMLELGVEKILVDGAWHRLMSADPTISDALILATGAVLGNTVDKVVEKTAWFVDRLTLPEADSDISRHILDQAIKTGRATALTKDGRILNADGPGSRQALAVANSLETALSTLALPGALPARFTDALVAAARPGGHDSGQDPLTLVVSDATRIFSGQNEFRRFVRQGHSIRVGRTIRLLAIAVNPINVSGDTLLSTDLSTALEKRFPDIPAIDFALASGKG